MPRDMRWIARFRPTEMTAYQYPFYKLLEYVTARYEQFVMASGRVPINWPPSTYFYYNKGYADTRDQYG